MIFGGYRTSVSKQVIYIMLSNDNETNSYEKQEMISYLTH